MYAGETAVDNRRGVSRDQGAYMIIAGTIRSIRARYGKVRRIAPSYFPPGFGTADRSTLKREEGDNGSPYLASPSRYREGRPWPDFAFTRR